ncbi:MAG TPA: UxaA family hydrolase [Dehalococcoidia bacterium]|nr:UxaA family hydrolase [Dehalococcoidia bacterium]
MPRLEAVVLNDRDNVATAIANLEKGAKVELKIGERTFTTELKSSISLGHKFSLRHINKGSPIIKYGEIMGTATKTIEPGEHIHIHNVVSARGRGDLSKEGI